MSRRTCDAIIGTDNIGDLLRAGSAMSTCDRGRVAAVLTAWDSSDKKRFIIGYSDSLADETCDSHGHVMENGHCVRTIHAEQMAVAVAAKNGFSTQNGGCHVNKLPCENCLRILRMAGIGTVYVYDKGVYKTDEFKARKVYAASIDISLLSDEEHYM